MTFNKNIYIIHKKFILLILTSIFILSFSSSSFALTTRSAPVRINNLTGLDLESVTVIHKYSDVFKSQYTWKSINNNSITPSSYKVKYNTGFMTTGADWWFIAMKVKGSSQIFISYPTNLRWIVDNIEKNISNILATYAANNYGPDAGIATKKIAGLVFNNEKTEGFKKHFLESIDEKNGLTIELHNSRIVFKSPSGTSETNYRKVN